MADVYRFDRFTLDLGERRLLDRGAPVDVNARYLDALALLVREAGSLVTKDRFMAEVWRGIPVTDEALTQGIRTLRRCLGDDAANPRFIETVPKHGYRFVAALEGAAAVSPVAEPRGWSLLAAATRDALAGTAGAAIAGLLGGLVYGFAAAAQPASGGPAALSIVAVVTILCVTVAVLGGAGVSAGIAVARIAPAGRTGWTLVGGALGGMIVGAVVKLIGLDAFNLVTGRAPLDITGPGEGVLLGFGVATGALLARRASTRRTLALAALPGALAGFAATVAGGRMMAGSLDLLGRTFPASRLRLDAVAALVGEHPFGPAANALTGTLEGALFAAGVVAAMRWSQRRHGSPEQVSASSR